MSSEPAAAAASRRGLRISALVLLVAAIAVVASGVATRSSDAARLKERAEDQAVPTVSVISPGVSGPAATLELPGRLEAQARAPIYARVSGYLKSWSADIGAPVKAGQLLAEIETPDLDQQLVQAQADLASARSNLALSASTAKRWQSLLAADAVSRQEAEERTGDLAAKQSAVNAAQANVDRFLAMKGFARILAPFDGTVTARSTDVGALINAGGGTGPELFVVSDTKRLRVYITLPQNYAAMVKGGTTARVSVPEHPGKSYAAKVESSARAINSGSGGMLMQLAVDNAGGELLPGGYASVSLDLPRGEGVLNVPPSALIFDKGGISVATVGADNRIVLKPVRIARDMGRVIELAPGLAPGERIVESPADGIANGELVRVRGADAAAGQRGKN